MTIPELVACARACHGAGAQALHAHVRDAQGQHVLDAGLYRELLAEMRAEVPNMAVQITTEALGRYSPQSQRQLVRDVMPDMVSISVKEQCAEGLNIAVKGFYAQMRAGHVDIQHIIYDSHDLDLLFQLIDSGAVPNDGVDVLFVLGRYAAGQVSVPENLEPFLMAQRADLRLDWSVCAFGHRETDCLLYANQKGGRMRVGFENNLYQRDGTLAHDNAERVRELVAALDADGPSA